MEMLEPGEDCDCNYRQFQGSLLGHSHILNFFKSQNFIFSPQIPKFLFRNFLIAEITSSWGISLGKIRTIAKIDENIRSENIPL